MANEFKIRKGLIVEGATSGTVVDVQGSKGQLFSVTDNLSGSIFAVSDISGVPILDVNSSGLSTFAGNVTIGSVDAPVGKGLNIGNASPTIQLFDTTYDAKLLMYTQDSGSIIGTYSNHALSFFTNSTQALEINTSQNATFAGDIVMANGKILYTDDIRANSGAMAVGPTGTADLTLRTDSVTRLTIDSAGDATFTEQAFSSATSSGDASSTLTTKGYVDGLITGATIYRGAWDPSGGGYGSPDLSGVTQTSGYYYICSAAGTAEPNGTGTEPDSWEVGDWVIYNDVSGTGQWQKIDNSSVLSGVGTGQTVALWEGAGSVTDSETLGNAPITVSGNNTTFAGDATLVGNLLGNTSNTTELGVYSTNAIKRIRMVQGGELHFGDTTTGAPLGITEGNWNSFGDQDRLSIYGRSSIKFYSGALAASLSLTLDTNATFAGTVTSPTFFGDLNGTINTATTGVTQTAGNNSTKIATTAYADAAAAAVPIGDYLPLSAGASYPLTGDLYFESSSTDVVMSGNGSGAFTIDNTTGQIAFKASGSTVQSMIITSSQISLNERVSVNTTSMDTVNKLQVNGQTRVVGQFMVGDSSAGNTALQQIHIKNSGTAGIRLEDSDNANLAFDLIVDEGVGFYIAETIGGDAGDDVRFLIEETTGNVGIGTTTPNAKLDIQGTQGQLFSVTDDLSGEIFAVADISGVPIMAVNSSGVSYFDDKVFINASASIPNRTEEFQVTGRQIITNTGTNSAALYLGYNSSGSNTIQLGRGRTADGLSYIDLNGEVMSAGDYGFRIMRRAGVNAVTDLIQVGTGNLTINAANGADTVFTNTNVGIGTTSPGTKLDVASTSSQYVAKFSHSTATGFAPGSILLEAGQGNSRGQGLYHYNTVADENWFTGVPYNVSSKKWIVANKSSVVQATDTAQLTYALMTIDSDTGNVGIGTTSPDSKLDVKGSSASPADGNQTLSITNTTGGTQLNLGTAENSYGWIEAREGATLRNLLLQPNGGNVGIGTTSPQTGGGSASWLSINGTAAYSGGIAYTIGSVTKGYSYFESGFLRQQAQLGFGHKFVVNGTNQAVTILSSGNVGIGDTTPSYKLDVNGTIRATGDVIAYSDARVKDNVVTIGNALEKVTQLRGVSYTRNDVDDTTTKIGVIAQEVLEVVPEVVQEDDEGKYSVAYGNMVGLLIESIKELKAEVDELKSRL